MQTYRRVWGQVWVAGGGRPGSVRQAGSVFRKGVGRRENRRNVWLLLNHDFTEPHEGNCEVVQMLDSVFGRFRCHALCSQQCYDEEEEL